MKVKQDIEVIDLEWKCLDYFEMAIEIGKKHHGHYWRLRHIGHHAEPLQDEDMLYVPLEQNKSWIPDVAWFHHNLLKTHGLPIEHIYIGHELGKERKKIERPQLPQINKEPVLKTFKAMGSVALGVATVVGYAAISALTVIDPIFIVTFEGEKEWMLCIASWDE